MIERGGPSSTANNAMQPSKALIEYSHKLFGQLDPKQKTIDEGQEAVECSAFAPLGEGRSVNLRQKTLRQPAGREEVRLQLLKGGQQIEEFIARVEEEHSTLAYIGKAGSNASGENGPMELDSVNLDVWDMRRRHAADAVLSFLMDLDETVPASSWQASSHR